MSFDPNQTSRNKDSFLFHFASDITDRSEGDDRRVRKMWFWPGGGSLRSILIVSGGFSRAEAEKSSRGSVPVVLAHPILEPIPEPEGQQ